MYFEVLCTILWVMGRINSKADRIRIRGNLMGKRVDIKSTTEV